MRITILLAFVFLAFTVEGRTVIIDSLENVLACTNTDVADRQRAYNDICYEYLHYDRTKCMKYAQLGIEHAKKNGYRYSEGTCYCTLGTLYYNVQSYDTALVYFNHALDIANSIDHIDLKSRCYGSIANLYNMQGNDHVALRYYLLALELFERENWKESMLSAYINIGVLYQVQGNNGKALDYLRRAEQEAATDPERFKDLLGNAYGGLCDVMIKYGSYEEALKYAYEMLDINTRNGFIDNYALSYEKLFHSYLYGFKNYDSASHYATKSIEIAEEVGIPIDIAIAHSLFSELYIKQGRYNQAEQEMLLALSSDTSDIYTYSDMIYLLATAQVMQCKGKAALENLDHYKRIVSNMAKSNYQSAIADLEILYETQKKEMLIEELEKERQLYFWLYIMLIFILLLVLAIFVSRQRLLKQRTNLIATRALLEGETSERARLSRDLHDGLGGLLSVAKHNIANMKGNLTIPDDQVEVFNSAIEMLDKSISELRRVAHNLMPESLMRYGLNSAIRDFCGNIGSASYFFFGNDKRFDDKLEAALFRIVSELVTNSLKHAKAEHITVQLVQEDDRVCVTVQDDGCGFNPNNENCSRGKGLMGIKNRVDSFNGHIDILSQPGKGTEITVDFNL